MGSGYLSDHIGASLLGNYQRQQQTAYTTDTAAWTNVYSGSYTVDPYWTNMSITVTADPEPVAPRRALLAPKKGSALAWLDQRVNEMRVAL